MKDFYETLDKLRPVEYVKRGKRTILLSEIVGSVGRAGEINDRFSYRNRPPTERFKLVARRLDKGEPMDPIKVYEVKNDKHSEYYVVDGHHRVAVAIYRDFVDIYAEVIEVVPKNEEREGL